MIYNRNFECFLGNADNLAEVATHEIGHGLGLGHSTVADAVMRSYAYGGARGPRLGADDLDAAHCHYPRPVAVVAPNGGETWTSGSQHTVLWTTPPEAGPDPGTVSIELSTNGGQTWSLLAAGEPDDGAWPWTLPAQTGSALQVRVLRPNRVSPTPAPYPSACSRDASNASFSIVASLAAGTVPGGAAGPPLTVARSGADLVLTWGPSCSGQATDYAVYEGSLAALRAGTWDLVPRDCSTGTDRTEIVSPGSGSRYYLVAALAAGSEGALGTSSSGAPRPAAPAACAPREASSCP